MGRGRGRHQRENCCLLLSGKTTEEELALNLADKFHNKDVVTRGETVGSGEETLFHALKILDCHEI